MPVEYSQVPGKGVGLFFQPRSPHGTLGTIMPVEYIQPSVSCHKNCTVERVISCNSACFYGDQAGGSQPTSNFSPQSLHK